MRTSLILLAACGLLWTASAATGDEPAMISVAQAEPPKELADEIRAALDTKAIRLDAESEPFFTFWFRKEIPLAKTPGEKGLGLDTVAEGTLLGAVKVDQERYDFKDEEIPPGVYVLRLGLQPEDGNHLGVSPTRTFVLLLPAAADRKLDAAPTHDDLVAGSSKVNAAEHPSNLNLQAVDEPGGEFPRLGEINGGEHKVLNVSLPGKLEGKTVPLKLALVYEGKGQI